MERIQIAIPEKAEAILSRLMEAGFEAYVVGGCVRDSLTGRKPKDWDITTSARPWQVKALFERTIDTGIEHGTVTVMIGHEGYEVTTYRIDGEYEDCRHPKQVLFTDNLVEDLKRRDFTINAMAYNKVAGVVDAFDGIGDLKRGVVRCVGDPGERFDEDALRILRAVRFSAQLGFEIDAATKAAIVQKAPQLVHISAERIQMELVKILTSPHPAHIKLACDLGITAVVMPEYDRIRGVSQHTPNHIYDVETHTLKALENVEADTILRWTMLMHDFGKPDVKKVAEDGREIFYKHPEVSARYADAIMKRLKFDNYTRERVVRLVKWHGLKYDDAETSVRRALNRVGEDIFEEFLKVQRADVLAKNPKVIPAKIALLERKEQTFRKIIAEKQCFTIRQLAISGRDLMTAGILPGPLLGAVLEKLTEAVIDDQSLNEKDKLIALAMTLKDDPKVFEEKEAFFMK
jgi:tRNA nucleotidyltransferase (CCA-adding enzyme)